MWFQLCSPELAEDFERLMAGDRDVVRGSLDTVSDRRLTRPADVPGSSIGQADAPNVVGLVYIAGFGLDEGESIGAPLKQGPPPPAFANIDVDSESFAWIPKQDFPRAPVRNRPALLVRAPLPLR